MLLNPGLQLTFDVFQRHMLCKLNVVMFYISLYPCTDVCVLTIPVCICVVHVNKELNCMGSFHLVFAI